MNPTDEFLVRKLLEVKDKQLLRQGKEIKALKDRLRRFRKTFKMIHQLTGKGSWNKMREKP